MTAQDAVAFRIMQLMKEKHMTQKELEQKSNVSHNTLNKILNSQSKRLTMNTINKITRTLDISIFDFFNHSIFYDINI